jgi:hypothetical protein
MAKEISRKNDEVEEKYQQIKKADAKNKQTGLDKRKNKGQVSEKSNERKTNKTERETKAQADTKLEMKRTKDEEQASLATQNDERKKKEEEEKRNATKS